MLAVWLPRSERLEAVAVRALGDPAIESILARVATAIEPSVRAGVRTYFGPEAGVETALGQPQFFVSLVQVHREGRWPCAWEGRYPEGRFVVL